MTRTTDYFLDDIRRFLSKWDVARLEKLGATVTRFAVTATEDQLGKWYKPELRSQLESAGVLTVTPETGGVPDWVPEGAVAFADFKNGHYYAGGAETTLGGVVENNSNWGTFDPATVVDGVGMEGIGFTTNPAVVGAVGAVLVPDFTLLARFSSVGVSPSFFMVEPFDSPDYVQYVEAIINTTEAGSGLSKLNWEAVVGDVPQVSSGDPHNIALTISAARMSVSIDGGAVVTITPSDAPIYDTIGLGVANGAVLTDIAFYAAKLDADLPALSAVIPDNAKIHIDLVNQFAWTEADGIVAIDTLLGADPNADAYTAITAYDEGYLSERGYSDATGAVAFIGAARTKLLAGSTFVIASNTSGTLDTPTSSSTILISADATAAIDFTISDLGRAEGTAFSGDYEQEILGICNYKNGTSVKNRLAATVTPTRAEFAVNGSDAQSKVLTTDEYPVSGGSAIVATLFTPSTHAFEFITIYDALPSTAGLSALSETGVTNTAPHDITSAGSSGYATGSGTEWSLSLGDLPEGILEIAWLYDFMASDGEGNPITFSCTDDCGGKFHFVLNGVSWQLKSDPVRVEDSPITVTIRATDPGGLYVEQQFTITVTA